MTATGLATIPGGSDDNKGGSHNGYKQDGLVIGSPVYGSGMTAQMKTLIDRLTLLNLFTLTFEHGRWVGVSCSGIAPTYNQVARGFQELGWCSGAIGAKCSSTQHGLLPLAESHEARLPERARALGSKLVRDIGVPCRPGRQRVGFLWIKFLHKQFLRPMVHNNPEPFAGVLRIWQEKGWA